MSYSFQMYTNKDIEGEEIAELMDAIGWGNKEDYKKDNYKCIKQSLNNFSFVAHIRTKQGILVLVAYVSAFSDEAFSTFVSELVVHPSVQGHGLGRQLLQEVEKKYTGVPIYIKSFEDTKEFFFKHGYTQPKRKMVVVSKRNNA